MEATYHSLPSYFLALYRLPEFRQITVSTCFQPHQILATSTDKKTFNEVDKTEESRQTNIGLTSVSQGDSHSVGCTLSKRFYKLR